MTFCLSNWKEKKICFIFFSHLYFTVFDHCSYPSVYCSFEFKFDLKKKQCCFKFFFLSFCESQIHHALEETSFYLFEWLFYFKIVLNIHPVFQYSTTTIIYPIIVLIWLIWQFLSSSSHHQKCSDFIVFSMSISGVLAIWLSESFYSISLVFFCFVVDMINIAVCVSII